MTSGVVSIPPGATRAQIPISVKADTQVEGTEFFVVKLDSPTNAVVERPQGTMELLDDDGPPTYTYISKFQPATRDGVAVKYRKNIDILLAPRR